MRDLKIAVIGSGSTYSPEIFEGIIKRKDSLSVKKIALMDIDETKLSIVGGLIERMVAAAGINAEIIKTTDLDTCLLYTSISISVAILVPSADVCVFFPPGIPILSHSPLARTLFSFISNS